MPHPSPTREQLRLWRAAAEIGVRDGKNDLGANSEEQLMMHDHIENLEKLLHDAYQCIGEMAVGHFRPRVITISCEDAKR